MAKRKTQTHNRPPHVEGMLQALRLMAEAIPEEDDETEYSRYDWSQPPRGYYPGVLAAEAVVYLHFPHGRKYPPIVLGITPCCQDAASDLTLLPNSWQLKSYNPNDKSHSNVRTVPNVRGNNTQAPCCDHCGRLVRLVDISDGEIIQ